MRSKKKWGELFEFTSSDEFVDPDPFYTCIFHSTKQEGQSPARRHVSKQHPRRPMWESCKIIRNEKWNCWPWQIVFMQQIVVLEKQCALELANSKKQNKYKRHVKAPGIRRSKNPIPTCYANKCTSCLQNICFDTKGPISLLEPQMPLSSGHPQTHPNSLHWMPLSNHAPPTLAVQPSALQSMERTGPSRGSSARSGWMRLIEMCFSFFGATIDQAKSVQCKPVMF